MHFMGYAKSDHAYTGEGRVCSPVLEFDKQTMRGRTRSGRVYELVGPPGLNADALYVWNRWLNINNNPVVTCITEDYYEKEKCTYCLGRVRWPGHFFNGASAQLRAHRRTRGLVAVQWQCE